MMKTEFKLMAGLHQRTTLKIIGQAPEHKPYVVIEWKQFAPAGLMDVRVFVSDSDLERLAVNILTALKSKRLKLKPKSK